MQIVAPAGSYGGLTASINAGADAVYLGMPQFGARAKAENFDGATLKSAVEYAHLLGVKVFVTLNILIKDSELTHALDAARLAYSLGVDAAIVQDIRFIKALKQHLPDLTLHASTQMGIHNADGAKALLDLGIARAVLSRETLPQDIPEIKKTGIDIEFFVQGALCVCFSGNCYFSSLASSYSGNRGKCMQLCRKPYDFNGNRGYFLSAKDLCLYNKLDVLQELGVDAIKIEGRLRSNEYAFAAVGAYSGSLDDPIKTLKSAFNRGNYCDGYLSDDAPFNVIYSKSQGNIGLSIGKITSVAGSSVSVKGFVPHKNDGFKIMRNDVEVCGATERDGKIVSSGTCKCGDELRRTFSGELTEKMNAADRRLELSVDVELECGKPPVAKIVLPYLSEITVDGDFVLEPAKTRGISESDVIRAFEKVSDFPFRPTVRAEINGNIFAPISALNEFRRKAYGRVKNEIIGRYKIKRYTAPYRGLGYNKFNGHGTLLMVESEKQLNEEIVSKVDYIVLNPRDYSDFTVPNIDKPILLNLPVVMRGNDRDIIIKAVNRPEIFGVVSNNLYTLNITEKPILLGVGHNIIGRSEYPHVTSFEADGESGGFRYVFGYAPLMTLCHCPYGKCINCSGNDELKDESGRVFKLRKYNTAHCYWQLLNCVPHYINEPKTIDLFFDCTACGKADIIAALNFDYRGNFTRGNVNKGLK